MIGVPVIAGSLSTAVSASSYQVPVTVPVPPGTVVTVFAGASGATAATSVTDSQGTLYGLSATSTSGQWLQAYTGACTAGLNPSAGGAGDYWTVGFASSSAQTKNILAVTAPGCATPDVTQAASGNSAAPSVTGTSVYGSELLLFCVQAANAGGEPSFPALTALGGEPAPGAQFTYAAWGLATRTGAVTAAASITAAAWGAILVTYPAAPLAALGNQASPSGGAQLPPYPVLPAPRTWSQGDMLLTPRLRADPQNALTLLANPPLVIAGQTVTTQSVPTAATTTIALDTELTDAWQSHSIPGRQVYPPLAGWYLTEGHAFLNDTVTGTVATAGIQVRQNGVTSSSDGGKVANNGVNFPIPTVVDLVQANPATDDSIALYVWQSSGSATPVASAWLKTEWVAAPSGTVVPQPAPAAGWTAGATTLLQPAGAGAGAVVVADPAGIVAGGVICLDAGNPAAENVTVTAVIGQTAGITDCAWPHPQGAPVAVPVSAAWMNQQVRDKIRFLSYRPIARLSGQGIDQGLPSQAWPAATQIVWGPPAGAGYRCVDNWGGFNGTAGYVFPVSGTYFVYGQVYVTDYSSPVMVSAGLAVDSGTIMWGDRTLSAGSTSLSVCATVRRTLRVAAGQYVAVYGAQNCGIALGLLDSVAEHSRMVVVWRGF